MREFHWRPMTGGGIRIWDCEDARRGAFSQLSTFAAIGSFLMAAAMPLGPYQDPVITLKRVPESEDDVPWESLDANVREDPRTTDGTATLLERPK